MDNTEQQNQGIKRVEDIVASINVVINKIPFSGNIQDALNNLRASLQALGPPRIMIIGRTRSGKSSLINAMCECKVAPVSHVKPETGKAEWKTYYHHGVDLVRILDTRGFQETEAPRQQDTAKTPLSL